MTKPDDHYLPTLISILERLQAKTSERGESMLSFLLDLAKAEAQDELTTMQAEAGFRSRLRQTSSAAPVH